MTTKNRTPLILHILLLLLVFTTLQARAQTAPVDLTEISLDDLLKVSLISSSESIGEAALSSWTIGYQFVHATFEGYLKGSNELSLQDVMATYPVVPTKIKQQAHMFMLRKQAGESGYFSAQVPWIKQETDHIRRQGDPFTIRTEGLGDIAVGYSWTPWEQGAHRVWLNAGMRLPSGSITETGNTPRGNDTLVPYTMQLGSGTFDATPGATYLYTANGHQLGASVNGLVRLGRNSRGYSLSDRISAALWATKELTPQLDASIKLEGRHTTRIDGADPLLDPAVAPVADADNFGGERIDVSAGITATLPCQDNKHTLRAEVGLPVHQDLNGPQPKLEMECTIYYGVTF